MRALKIAAMSLEGLRRTPLRVALTTLGVSIASGALVSMVAFALGLQHEVETPFRVLELLNNIQVSPHEGKPSPPLDDDALARLARLPGVAAAYPDIRVKGVLIRQGDKTETGLALAMPREAEWIGVADELLVAGRFFSPGDQPEAILGTHLVRGLGFASPHDAVGKRVRLEAAGLSPQEGRSFTFQRKELSLVIVGVYEPPPIMPPAARQAILLPIELMKEIPGVHLDAALERLKAGGTAAAPGYSRATVRVRHPNDLDAVTQAIEAMGYRARPLLSRLQGMKTFFVVLQVLLAAVGTVGLVIAALGIINTLLMSVVERYQEIGIYKALGASDGDLFVLFLTEAGVIGMLGGLGGLLLGGAVSWVLEAAANAYARAQGTLEPLRLFAFPFGLLAATVLFSAAVSVVAGVYPALRAARVDPIRALRRA